MAAEMKKLEGVKIEKEEAKKLDPAKMGVSLAGTPKEEEVEAQARYYCSTQCPWCLHWGRSICDTDRIVWYTCGTCGGLFKVYP